jgi:hypothetical protein
VFVHTKFFQGSLIFTLPVSKPLLTMPATWVSSCLIGKD